MKPTLALLLGLTLAIASFTGCRTIRGWAPTRPSTPAPPPTGLTDSQRHSLEEAQAAFDAGEYDTALAMFRDILAVNPTITTAYIGIGQVHMVEQNYEKAEPAFARAARLEPRNFDAQYLHGVALQMLERFVEAVNAYHRALTIRPENPKANLNIATTYLQMDRPDDALAFAERAAELDPQNGAARANLGALYERLGRNAEAVDEYLVAMELLDDNTPLMMNLINVLAKEKRYREAANTAETLVRIEPSAKAFERLGWAYFRLGEYDSSSDAYRNSVEFDPEHWPAWTGVGVNALNTWLLSERQDNAARREARDALRRSLRINPDQPKLVTLMSNYGL